MDHERLTRMRTIPLLLLLPALACAQQTTASATLFVDCQGADQPQRLLSRVSLSHDEKWRAYVEVQSDSGCLHTTRLWVARTNEPYRLVYMIPPTRIADGNGMEVIGWAKNSRMLLVRTEEWTSGSDAPDTQRVLAVDAGTGMVYEPDLEAMLRGRKDKQCFFRLADAGFAASGNVDILVRARFSTAIEADETEEDVPPEKRCRHAEETWSFNFATGEIRQVANTQPLPLQKNASHNLARCLRRPTRARAPRAKGSGRPAS